MDRDTEQTIWQRVRGPGLPAEEALLPQRLEALIQEQGRDGALLEALGARLSGRGAVTLRNLAGENRRRRRELTTLHYLLTGRRLRLRPPAPPRPGPLPEALREAALALDRSARSFRSLEAEFADYAGDFSRWEAESSRGSRQLRQVLQATLPGGKN